MLHVGPLHNGVRPDQAGTATPLLRSGVAGAAAPGPTIPPVAPPRP
jgi:hypothetical protein